MHYHCFHDIRHSAFSYQKAGHRLFNMQHHLGVRCCFDHFYIALFSAFEQTYCALEQTHCTLHMKVSQTLTYLRKYWLKNSKTVLRQVWYCHCGLMSQPPLIILNIYIYIKLRGFFLLQIHLFWPLSLYFQAELASLLVPFNYFQIYMLLKTVTQWAVWRKPATTVVCFISTSIHNKCNY